jgi:hypothetical protein
MTQQGPYKVSLDRFLECGIILNWEALKQTANSSIQVEYRPGPDLSLEYLRVWASASRGYWKLVCAYWTRASPGYGIGLSFSNGYESDALAEIVRFAVQHPEAFLSVPGRSPHGLVQVQPPTAKQISAAATWMANCYSPLTNRRAA